MGDNRTGNLFDTVADRPGAMGCRLEIAATMREALEKARAMGMSREDVATRMVYHLGERISKDTLDGLVAPSHTDEQRAAQPRDIKLIHAMAFDAAVEQDALMGLFAHKRGGRQLVTEADAALLEWARLHHEEKALADRRRALEAILKVKGVGK